MVSPLIALQRDQIAGLLSHGAPEAVAVNSAQPAGETEAAWEAVRHGDAEYVFLSPEQLAKDELVERLARAAPSLFVVDEAQCVTAWGHDFRPGYLRLAQVVQRVGRPAVLALTVTATAAPPVREEIVRRLGMEDAVSVVAGFDRPNITLEVRCFARDADKRGAVVERAASAAKPGIVYTATRKDAEGYAAELAALGLSAAAYHAGLAGRERSRVHDASSPERRMSSSPRRPSARALARRTYGSRCTPRCPVHRTRTTRRSDGQAETALRRWRFCTTGLRTSGLQRLFAARTPDAETLSDVARAVHDRDAPVGLDELGEETGLPRRRVTAAANLLEQAGAMRTDDEGRVRAAPGVTAEEAVERAAGAAESRERLERSRLDMMRAYAESPGCRRRFLLGYFGEAYEAPCGACDVCRADSTDAAEGTDAEGVTEAADAPPSAHPAAAAYGEGTRVRHDERGDDLVMSEEGDRITLLFDSMGYRTLSLAAVADRELLTRLDV